MHSLLRLSIAGAIVGSSVAVHARTAGTHPTPDTLSPRHVVEHQDLRSLLIPPSSVDGQNIPVLIRHLRLEPSAIATDPTATVKFEVYNTGDADLADIELTVSLLGPPADGDAAIRRVLVRPFKVRVNTVLLAGYSLEYEIRLSNVSAPCECLPRIDVIGGRSIAADTR